MSKSDILALHRHQVLLTMVQLEFPTTLNRQFTVRNNIILYHDTVTKMLVKTDTDTT
jgi:hypothetical protein